MSVSAFEFQAEQWKQLYEAAMIELNPIQLPLRIETARRAMLAGQKQLGSSPAEITERRQLADAMRMLQMLLKIEITTVEKKADYGLMGSGPESKRPCWTGGPENSWTCYSGVL
jgi:hypothetical protein